MNIDNLFVEKYRPQKLEDIILSATNRDKFFDYKKTGEVPNIALIGTPGIGKTTLAKIVVKDILKCQYMYLNASDENGIDTIRNKVINFAKTKSIDGKLKIIILDEADALSLDAQRALRNTMEEYSGYTRFILTGNYKYKITTALLSRCQTFDLTPDIESVVKRCYNILKTEDIKIPDNKQFIRFIKTYYPDIRKCLNELQKNIINGVLNINDISTQNVVAELYNLINKKDLEKLRKYLISNEGSFNNDYITVLRELFKYIDAKETNQEKKKISLLIVSDYLYKSAFVVDQEINCYACMINLLTNV